MADPKIYAHTYWAHKGKYPKVLAEIQKLIPASGGIPGWSATHNKELEKFRIASNCYYDLYNNGLCNRLKDFRKLFGSCGYKRGDELTEEIVNNVETRMDEIILLAAKEQGIACPEVAQTSVQDEVDRLSAELASRIPESFLKGWEAADRENYEMEQEVVKSGIRDLLKAAGKRYFALSRPHHNKKDGELTFWLNPYDQQENNSGWFTLTDLKEWAEGKGKIPMKGK